MFTLEARPTPASPDFTAAGGAFIVCYIDPALTREPLAHASAYVRGQHWEVVAVEDEPLRIHRDEAPDEASFDQALDDGQAYVFHQWPLEDSGGATRH